MISLLCPSRRHEAFERMQQSVQRTSSKVSILSDQGQFPEYLPTVHKWNMLTQTALRNTDVNLFMLAADDIIFDTTGWDQALRDHYNALKNKIHVFALQDSRDPNGTPHPIVTREWIIAMGYAFPPIFLHWFVDTWTVAIASSVDAFTHLKDFKLIHDKPSDYGRIDKTHTGIRSMGWHQRDQYTNDTCQHFLEFEKQRLAKHFT